MSYIPPKTHNDLLHAKIQAHNPQIVDGHCYNFAVPKEFLDDYKRAIAEQKGYFEWLVTAFHEEFPAPPYSYRDFLDFMKHTIGFTATVVGFESPSTTRTSGTWEWGNEEHTSITIYVNMHEPEVRRTATVIHECLHAIQDVDLTFHRELERYPKRIRLNVAERISEKTVWDLLLPQKQIRLHKANGRGAAYVATVYSVSRRAAEIAYAQA